MKCLWNGNEPHRITSTKTETEFFIQNWADPPFGYIIADPFKRHALLADTIFVLVSIIISC